MLELKSIGEYMKILVFTDLHGSLNSLKSLINTDDYKTADKIIFLGDVAIGCSRPNECIELLKKMNCICLLGNNDSYVVDHIPQVDFDEFSSDKIEMINWMIENISEENKKIIKSWSKDYSIVVDNKKLYFTHYVWEDYNNDINVIDTPSIKEFNTRKEMFKDINADYIFFGHEHKTNYFFNGSKHYFCLGTSGLKNPGSYLVININKNNDINLEEKFVNFDINEEIKLMDLAGYPYEKHKIKK